MVFYWLWQNTPRHSLLTPVTSYVGVFLLKEPPVIDGSAKRCPSWLTNWVTAEPDDRTLRCSRVLPREYSSVNIAR
jgi:hypothetical protein